MNKRFMGYGSPQALEESLKDDDGGHFVIYTEGLIHASVCTDRPQSEVIAFMANRVSGTTGGWSLSEKETFSTGEPNPCPCDKKPETHKHYLFNC